MSRFLYRLGGSAAAHPWRTISAWILVAATAVALASMVGGTPKDVYDVPDARAQVGVELLREHAPEASGAQARVVVHDEAGGALPTSVLERLDARLAAMDHVTYVTPPRLSEDGDTALVTVQYDLPVTDPDLFQNTEPLEEATSSAVEAGFQVELGGELPESAAQETDGRGEMIGVGVALILLVLTFASVVSAGLPLAVALFGLAFGSAGVTVLAAVTDVSTSAPTVATMVGLGVGIDYALLLVTRHVENLRAGYDVRTAAARASATAGRSVVFASATVLVSLMGLRLSGLPVYSSFGFATAIVVVAVMAAAVTLVPALCGLAGRRVMPRAERRGATKQSGPSVTARWADKVGRRPLAWAMAAALVMLTLAAPTLTMRTWPQDASSQSQDATTRQAYDLVAEEFGAGANASYLVVAERSELSDSELNRLTTEVADFPGVSSVGPVQPSANGALATFEIQPDFGPADERTGDLVSALREDVLPEGAELTGQTPVLLRHRRPAGGPSVARHRLRGGGVRGAAGHDVPVGRGADQGGLDERAVDRRGVRSGDRGLPVGLGRGAARLDHSVPVSSWLPILMFAILFGLSMDYEVFLLSRIREDWQATGDARASVVRASRPRAG
jgi:RND superfamily putative drug exporter